jgi:uncharacterized membrane protein YcaP (DUF421 family)
MALFFDNWTTLARTLIIGVMAYTALVLLLRVSGKRTLSKMNAFDLIVTVALGSTLATILLSKDVVLAQGLLALGLLIGMQYAVTWLSVRLPRLAQIVKNEPSLLFYQGRYLPAALQRERVTASEVRAAIRAQGQTDLAAVSAVVLETDGSITVMLDQASPGRSALQGVTGFPPDNAEVETQNRRSS